MSESTKLYNFLINNRNKNFKKNIIIKKTEIVPNISHKIKFKKEINQDPFNSFLLIKFQEYLKLKNISENFFNVDILGQCIRYIYYEKMNLKGKEISPFYILNQYYGMDIKNHLRKFNIDLKEKIIEDQNCFYLIIKSDKFLDKNDLLFFKYKYDIILNLISNKFNFNKIILIGIFNNEYVLLEEYINKDILEIFFVNLKKLFDINIPKLKLPENTSQFPFECDMCKYNILCKKDNLKNTINNNPRNIPKFLL